MKIKTFQFCILLLFAIITQNAIAVLVWNWDFIEPTQTVLPTEDVIFTATLFNDASSTEYIYGGNYRDLGYWVRGASCCTAGMNQQYNFNNPGVGGDVRESPNFMDQFSDLQLAPGESFEFAFLNLTPLGGSVELGIYDFLARLNLGFQRDSSVLIERYSGSNPSIIVEMDSVSVSEPSSFTLLLISILTLLAINKKTKNA